MSNLKLLFREANQMIVGGRLFYFIEESDFKLLEAYATHSPALKQALRDAYPLNRYPGGLVLVPADLIKEAEADMIV